MLIHVDKVFTV